MQAQSLDWEDPLEQKMAAHSSILLGEFHGQRSLGGCSPWGLKELDKTACTHVISMFRPSYSTFLSPFILPLS